MDIAERLMQARAPQDDLEGERLRAAVLHRLVAEEPHDVRIGRFVVLQRIGSGGNGVVYAAYDPQLDRRVALKLVRKDGWLGHDREQAEARWFREAQTMARLSHPNVLAVHDVAVHGTQTYIVLDLVDGLDLRSLLREQELEWKVVVDVFVQAGRGLAAAHRAGVVHRDFKPANVLVSGFGTNEEATRVQVMDFGLATPSGDTDSVSGGSPSTERESTRHPSFESGTPSDLTGSGAVVGTPAYMAPEQHRGESVDAKADQFAFCVALYEALYGRRPFHRLTAVALLTAIEDGPPRPPKTDARVPARLFNTIARGLSYDPADRWPSMEALLDALQRTRSVGPIAVMGTTAALALGLGLAAWASTQEDAVQGCGTEERISSVWGQARQRDLKRAFSRTELPYADRSWTQTQQQVDAYTQAWASMHVEACERSHSRVAPELGHLQLACLEQRRGELDGFLGVLEQPDRDTVEHAVAGASSLTPVAACTEAMAAEDLDTPSDDSESSALRIELARARGLERAGQYADAHAQAKRVLERATDNPSLQADALIRLGSIHARAGEYVEAERRLADAAWSAEANRLERAAAEATTLAVLVVGARLQRRAEGRLWAAHARAAIERLDGPPLLRAELESNLGVLDRVEGRFASARDRHEAALSLRRKMLGPDHPLVATSQKELGNVLYEWGNHAAALTEYEGALAIRRRVLGPDHPAVAVLHNNLANALVELGRVRDARAHLQRALDIWNDSLPAGHPSLGMGHHNLANVLQQSGSLDEAVEHYTQAIEIASAALGADNPTLARYHTNLAEAQLKRDNLPGARTALDAAIEIWDRGDEVDHPDRATLFMIEGRLAARLGDPVRAAKQFRAAAKMRAALFGPEHHKTQEAWDSLSVLPGAPPRAGGTR